MSDPMTALQRFARVVVAERDAARAEVAALRSAARNCAACRSERIAVRDEEEA